jgi:hypothetical protein
VKNLPMPSGITIAKFTFEILFECFQSSLVDLGTTVATNESYIPAESGKIRIQLPSTPET